MRIFIGNVALTMTEDAMSHLFAAYGVVRHVRLITDHATGHSRGFAFVDMPNESEAQAAIAGLNGRAQGGRRLIVNEARPWEE